MAEYEIFLPQTLNNDYSALLELYQQVEDILPVLGGEDSVAFNFGNIRWINAEMTVFLGMIFSVVTAKGATVYALLDNLSLKSKEILLKNGFLKHFGLKYELDDIYNTTIPFFWRNIENIEEIDEYIDDELLRQIRNNTNEEFLGEIKEALLEIIHNVRDHSHSDVLYMCGQHYPRKPRDSKKGTISFAISDNGIGMIENIKNKGHSFSGSEDYFKWAFNKGTSTKENYDSGVGLYLLKKKLYGKGEIKIVSNNGYYHIEKTGNITFKKFPFNISGTLAIITLFLDDCQNTSISDTIDLSGLLEEWFI
nr:MAG TPA: Heat shock protein HSP 90-alpha PROTEIN, ATP BINDING, CHAPERONE [Caudoviricetes sp.]